MEVQQHLPIDELAFEDVDNENMMDAEGTGGGSNHLKEDPLAKPVKDIIGNRAEPMENAYDDDALSVFSFSLQYEVCQNETELNQFRSKSEHIHRRSKRALVFPKGSAFVMTLSALKTIPIKGFTWNQLHEFDVVWPIQSAADKPKPKLKQQPKLKLKYPMRKPYYRTSNWNNRRHRRELYSTLELALENYDLPGKTCILRTICEAKTLLNPSGESLIEDLLRVILSNPIKSKKSMDDYDLAHQMKEDCDLTYPCPFSLLNFFLNYNGNGYD
ncbi:uncharacterized protein LOC117182746 [Belonocnema kinseyi]|uniref:uncharacterized protein LOC117182746 n=1 Tax=Belonocnema kinseyi TaxID=2817044 RepID=UPI00143DDA06|nr:uncharacterized protein LOC117182746 [Belonocnema kinseyi]